MAFKKYPKYKDSGIEWLGEIPEHWENIRLKFHAKITTGNKNTEDKEPTGVYNFYVRSQKVERINSFSFEGEGILTAGDGVGVGKVFHYVNEKFDYHQRVYLFFDFSEITIGKFLFHYLREKLIIDLKLYNAKSTVDSVRLPTLKEFIVATPTKPEQTTIANFLDYKLEKITRFISKKKQLVKLLQEQKAAIINQAVTKGVDSSVKMKDSGVEWLGEIPAHWEVRKLKYVGKCQNGISASAAYFGSGFPFITYGDVYKNFSLPAIGSGLANSSLSDRKNYSVKKGDIFFTRTSETIEEIGFTSTCMETIENATFSGFIIRVRPYQNMLSERYSTFYFRSSLHRRFFVKEMNLVTRASLSQDLLKKMPILLPPILEQVIIANYIETQTKKINKTIATIQKEITLAKEYKTALIAEAVTGKIDVRDFKMPQMKSSSAS